MNPGKTLESVSKSAAFAVSVIFVTAVQAETDAETVADNSREGADYYFVKKWDTLWDLSGQFLNDPFQWREIWKVNPSINNPHLIYPGDRLAIPGLTLRLEGSGERGSVGFDALTRGFLDNTSAYSSGGFPEDGDTAADSTVSVSGALESPAEIALRDALSSESFFSSDYLARVGFLWFEKDARGKIFPGNGYLEECGKQEVFRRFDEVGAKTYDASAYREGDTVDIFHSLRFVGIRDRTANLVRRVGRGRVTRVAGKSVRLQLSEVWDIVSCRDRIAPVGRVPSYRVDRVVEPNIRIEAAIVERVENTVSPYPFQSVIVDVGARDGVQLGDVFQTFPVEDEKTSAKPAALACVTNVQQRSSSLSIIKMYRNRVDPRDSTYLVKRIVFK